MNPYEAKQEARRERLLNRAERLKQQSEARFKAASAAVAGIPFGQPILVGHHSERRHRSDLAKHDNNMRKGVEAAQAARDALGKANSIGDGGISSDDPNAAQKITERLEGLKRNHERMKLVNRYLRAKNDDGLKQMGFDEAQIATLKKPDSCGRAGFPDYALKNNTANIARLEQRLRALAAMAKRETSEKIVGDVRIVHNAEENRLQLIFPAKPSDEMRAKLKSNGFRWSPTNEAWQRQLNNAAIYAAGQVLK